MRWFLKGKKARKVVNGSGQDDLITVRILWSKNLGLCLKQSFSCTVHDKDTHAQVDKLVNKINEAESICVDLWDKDFYPHNGYLAGSSD